MKILIADQFSELGGAQRELLELLPALQREGRSCILAIPGHGVLKSRAEAMGVRCEEITCGPFHNGSKSFSDLVRFGSQFVTLRSEFRRLVEEFRPDVLYVNGPRLVPAACSRGDKSPPVLFHLHSYLKQRYVARLTGRFLRRARASVVGNCQFVLDPLREYLGESDTEVIYNGVADLGFQAPRGGIGRIGIIGRIAPEKGQKVFAQAAHLVHAEMPQISFVICGGTQFSDAAAEMYLSAVREYAAGLPVEFTGWQDDIGDVLRRLDLLVVASMPLAEATTRVIPEAYSAGVPVLASDLPGIREILKDGETGFLFPAGQPGALADRIREIAAASPASLAAIVGNARRAFEDRFRNEEFQRRMVSSLARVGARART